MKKSIHNIISALQAGKMVIVTDHKNRENEGDLVLAAEFITPEIINFMLTYARGVICLSMTKSKAKSLGINKLENNGVNSMAAPFGLSFDAAKNITTGVSADDRAESIKAVLSDQANNKAITTPGHMFPLICQEHGVLTRPGHTEASVDLMKLSQLKHLAVICEILNSDGTMAREQALEKFSQKHQIPIISIEEIIQHRKTTETPALSISQANLPTEKYGDLIIEGFLNPIDQTESVAIYPKKFEKNYSNSNLYSNSGVLTRVHSSCLTGDLLNSLRCDCGSQLDKSLKLISENNGVLIYLNQEGRGIGLLNKIKSYALQENNIDTVEANIKLGFQADERDYWLAAQILKKLNCLNINLLTNNQDKITQLAKYGINIVQRTELFTQPNKNNLAYLTTKQNKLGHLFKI